MKKVILTLAIACTTSLLAADGAALYKKCAGCHGAQGEKTNFAKIQGLSKGDIVSKLNAYKGGQGGAKKAMMIPQVKPLNDGQIDALASYIAKF